MPTPLIPARRRPVRLLLVMLLLWTAGAAQAQDTAKPHPAVPAVMDLQDGDTLVFLGDSITHQRLYTQYVEDFFYTRFPDRRIRFHNAGIGGARAWDALQRLSRDVLAYKPRYVTVLLGMNDGSYRPFDTAVWHTYRDDMLTLIERLRAGGTLPILISPTMFDARPASNRDRWQPETLSEYNSVLAFYGKWLQHQAVEHGFGFVDMYGPLNALTVEQRKSNPEFTLIADAVHPDAPGQVVMAAAIIQNMGLQGPLSNIRIVPAANGRFRATASGGKVTDLTVDDNGIEFDWKANGLPWVVPEEARPGAELVKLGHRASREALAVHGLPAGNYELSIDDVAVGKWNSVALAGHIELQSNPLTPQYQQALEVAMLNKQRNEGPVRQLRDFWYNFQNWARQSRSLEQQPDNADLRNQVTALREKLNALGDEITRTEAEAKAIEDRIYTANQPVVRHYRIKRVTD